MADLGNLFFTLGIKMGDVEGIDRLMKELDRPRKVLSELEKMSKSSVAALGKNSRTLANAMNAAATASEKEKNILAATTSELTKQTTAADKAAASNDRLARSWERLIKGGTIGRQTADNLRLAGYAKRPVAAAISNDYWRRQEILSKSIEKANKPLERQNRLLSQLRTAASTYVSIWTAGQFLKSLVRITGEFELQRVSLRAMLNDINAADKIFSQTKLLAVESPFQFMDLMGFAKQLAAFSVPVNELFDTTKMLSDISAGLGVDMGRIVLAYSQIRSAGFLKGTELRQLTEAGVPVLEDLSRMFTQMEGQAVTIGDVFERISLRQVPFEMIEQVFKDMTSEGGKFYRMQEIQAETLRGQVSNLVDAWQIALYELGSSSDGILKFGVGAIRTLIENLNLVIPAITGVATGYGMYTAASIIANNTTKGMALSLTKLGKAFKAVGTAVKTNPFVAILTALAALAPIIIRLIKRSNELENSLRDIADMNFSGAEESVYNFQKLIKQLGDAEKGSRNYSDAVMALNSKYGEYLPNLLSEADALETVTSKYHDVTNAIYAKAQAQAYEAQMNKISEEYDSDIAEYVNSLKDKLIKDLNITRAEANDIVLNFTTGATNLFRDGRRFSYEPFNPFPSADAQSIDNQEMEFYRLLRDIIRQYTGKEYSISMGTNKWLRKYLNTTSDKYDDMELAKDIVMGNKNAKYDTAEERRRAEDIEQMFREREAEAKNDGSLNVAEYEAVIQEAKLDRAKAYRDLYHELGNTSKEKSYEEEIAKLLNDDIEKWVEVAAAVREKYGEPLGYMKLEPDAKTRDEHYSQWKSDYDRMVAERSRLGDLSLVNPETVQYYDNAIAALDELGRKLGFGEGWSLWDSRSQGNDAAREQLDLIRDWIDRIKEVRDLYEEFRLLGVQDAQMMSLFGSIFGEFEGHGIDSGALAALRGYNFDEALRIYNDMLRNGTPEMQAAADENDEDEALRNAEQRLEQLERAKKIGEQLQGVYEELAGIMAVSGTGVEHDFSKIVSDLRRQENELRRERNESRKDIEEKYGIDEKLDEYNSAMDAVDRLYNAKLDNLRANASEKIRDLASKYVDEQIKENRLDLSDYADKTIKQIRGQLDVLWDIYGQIQNELVLAQGEQTVAEALGEDIDSTLLSKIEMLKEALAQLGIIIGNTGDEKLKKIYNNAQSCVSAVSSLGGEIAAMGSEMENANLEAFGNALQDVADIAGDLISSLSSGNWAGFAIGLVTKLISAITGSISNEMQEIKEYEQNLIDFQNALKSARMNISEDDYDTIFGTNSFQKAADAYKKAQENLAEYQRLSSKKMEEPALDQSQMYVGNAMSLLDTQMDAYERGLTELQGMAVKTRDRNGFMEWLGFHDEFTSLADLAPDIFNDDGSLNVENAKLFLETNTQISDEQRKQIQNVIDAKEQYEELMGIVKDVNAELMSEVSDDISNAIFDAVLNGADAWDAFNDSAVRVIDNIGRKMIQEFIVQSYLNQFQDELEAAWGKEDTPQALAEILFDIYGGLGEVLGEGMEAYQDWLDMMQANGLDISSLYGQGESLGKDIQRITEDQADLLASYINAIRAYVAQLVERGIATGELLTSINENINIALSVLKEINGNTQAINENTAQVGRLMKSLTTSGSSVAINARIM